MGAIAARRPDRSPFASVWRHVAVHPLLCLVTLGAGAQELHGFANTSSSGSAGVARSRIELSSTSSPLFENTDGSTRTSRLDLIWLPPRHPNLGLALGLSTFDGATLKTPGGNAAPAFDLGLQWRYSLDNQYRIDVTAWRRMQPPDALSLIQNRQSDYGARVEMQIGATPSSHFVAERGFLGVQLDGGARISVRRSAGHPMLYYRAGF